MAFVAKGLRVPYVCRVVTESFMFDSIVPYQMSCHGAHHGSVSLPSSSYHHFHVLRLTGPYDFPKILDVLVFINCGKE